MDGVIIEFISLLQEYPLIGFAIALGIFALLLLVKKMLLRAMTPPPGPVE